MRCVFFDIGLEVQVNCFSHLRTKALKCDSIMSGFCVFCASHTMQVPVFDQQKISYVILYVLVLAVFQGTLCVGAIVALQSYVLCTWFVSALFVHHKTLNLRKIIA